MAFPIGAAIAAGSNLLGGLIGSKSADKASDKNASAFSAQLKLQEDLAQYGIRWRVEDAKAAGIHPLAALGANLISPSPIGINFAPDYSMADAVGNMGQNIGRAIDATRTAPERQQTFQERATQALQLQRMRLENELIATEISNARQAQNPPIPTQVAGIIQGQGNGTTPTVGPDQFLRGVGSNGTGNNPTPVVDVPLERTAASANMPHAQAAAAPEVGWLRARAGGRDLWVPSRGKAAEEALEDDILGGLAFAYRNQLQPMLGHLEPPFPAPMGTTWRWDYFNFGYYLEENKFKEVRPNEWHLNLREER